MALTPNEFHLIREGWEWRDEHQTERIAQWVAVLINNIGMVKQKVTPQQLLGRPMRAERRDAERKKSVRESSSQE